MTMKTNAVCALKIHSVAFSFAKTYSGDNLTESHSPYPTRVA